MQALTYLNPVRYFVEVLRGSLLRGAGASDLWAQMAALAAFGVLILGFASIRFPRRAEKAFAPPPTQTGRRIPSR
jgi:ABC-2 type transport system permease protein